MFLTTSPIDLAALLAETRSSDGALCLFVGVVRDHNDGRATTAIQYEAYGPMAESEMARIAEGLAREFPAVKIGMKHRVGTARASATPRSRSPRSPRTAPTRSPPAAPRSTA